MIDSQSILMIVRYYVSYNCEISNLRIISATSKLNTMEAILEQYKQVTEKDVKIWFKAAPIHAFPKNAGACIKYGDKQIAVFHFARTDKWYACQNLCPHKMEMVLARGLTGFESEIPKVACPLHKRTFSLETGENLNSDLPPIATYPVQIRDGFVYVGFAE